MRIEDCVLTGDFVVGAPFTRTEPEEEWVRARDSGAIPVELFELYRRAHYLSFGSAPKFLADPDNVLFSYFSMLLRSVMESFVDSQEQLQSFIDEQRLKQEATTFQKRIKERMGICFRFRITQTKNAAGMVFFDLCPIRRTSQG